MQSATVHARPSCPCLSSEQSTLLLDTLGIAPNEAVSSITRGRKAGTADVFNRATQMQRLARARKSHPVAPRRTVYFLPCLCSCWKSQWTFPRLELPYRRSNFETLRFLPSNCQNGAIPKPTRGTTICLSLAPVGFGFTACDRAAARQETPTPH